MGSLAEPFLKWAGGKRGLSATILQHFPKLGAEGKYFEPFLGGGALFFALQPRYAVLSDINSDLVDAFQSVRDDVEMVIAELRRLPYDSSSYYEIRSWKPYLAAERAARFIYLNKTCFNGLYRVNRRGEFNVPFGRHGPSLVICDATQLRNASLALAQAQLLSSDFEKAIDLAGEGDLVYCDPPYTAAHSNNGFIEYNARVFSWDDQHRLAEASRRLMSRGGAIVISNADHPSISDCFMQNGAFEMKRIERWTTIASRSSRRFRTTELVFVSHSRG